MAGARLGPYSITSALGAGGMGEVYKARDVRLDRDVAIKVLAPSLAADARFKERFEREARVVASLNHPHICTLYDVGEHQGAAFLVMEYLEGETLAARLARERVPFETVLAWGIQVADALALAHAKGVVHRDLKPANIMLVRRGGPSGPPSDPPDAKVLDFGLAKAAELATATLAPTMAVTDAGTAVGTVAYMSPEQARGEPIDARSDIFSFGAVLYEMATGHAAFGGTTTAVIFEAIFNRPVRPLRDVVADVPAEFASLVDRMLSKRPADRSGSCSRRPADETMRKQLKVLLDRAENGYVPAVSVACIYAGLNDRERALAALDRAYAQRDVLLSWHLAPLIIFDDLRSDPRFADLHRRVFGA